MRAPFAVIAVVLVGCAPDGVVQQRPYSLELPDDVRTTRPLLVLLHGFAANGEMQDLVFPFSKHVHDKQFIYARPHGTFDPRGRRFWNATNACCQPEDNAVDVDDVAYLRAVIDDVASKHDVDRSAVFLVGHSNGGFMALRMACEASDVISGIVSVAGAAAVDEALCRDGSAVPVLQIHGTDDTIIRFGGGATDFGPYPSALETVSRLASRNGCGTSLSELERIDIEKVPGAETKREQFDGCPERGAVELWSMEGASHIPSFNEDWPTRVFDWLIEHAK